MSWINRGNAALYETNQHIDSCLLPSGVQTLNLNQRGFVGQIACIEEGLKYITKESDPESWGQLHRAIGNSYYFYGRHQQNSLPFWIKAISSYETALEIFKCQQLDPVYLKTLQELIRLQLGLTETQKAEELLREGTALLDARLERATKGLKKRIENYFRPHFHELSIDLYVQQEKLTEALEIAEKNKNTFLRDWANDKESSPTYRQMCNFLLQNLHTAIIYWHMGNNVLTTFLLAPNASEVNLTLPDLLNNKTPKLMNSKIGSLHGKKITQTIAAKQRSLSQNQRKNR
jgi:tetratricopeptide (TPR) repeat protein